jgi:DNA modification methylase
MILSILRLTNHNSTFGWLLTYGSKVKHESPMEFKWNHLTIHKSGKMENYIILSSMEIALKFSSMPENCIDVVLLTPYFLQLHQNCGVRIIQSLRRLMILGSVETSTYDAFTHRWLSACKRILKIRIDLVIGTYHNILDQYDHADLGFSFKWYVWIKTDLCLTFVEFALRMPMKTLIWACKHKGAKYTLIIIQWNP